jgi:transcriptional regulator with GAF, ATPase, and Fis domain
MQDRAALEFEKLRLVKGETIIAPSSSKAARNNKIEALKTLVQAILNEIEALHEVSTLDSGTEVNLSDEVHRYEADLIRCALIRTGGRQRRAARLLNMKVATLNAKIKRYHLDTDALIHAASNVRQSIK